MLVDLRRYTLRPGRLKAYLAAYQEHGFDVQRRYLGQPLGHFVSEVGELNQVVHLWGYDSHAERESKRAALEADPGWMAYREVLADGEFMQHQENQLLRSTPFSPL